MQSRPSVGRKQSSGALEAGPSAPSLLETRNVLSQTDGGFFVGDGAAQPREGGRYPPPTPTRFRAQLPQSGKDPEKDFGWSRGCGARTLLSSMGQMSMITPSPQDLHLPECDKQEDTSQIPTQPVAHSPEANGEGKPTAGKAATPGLSS